MDYKLILKDIKAGKFEKIYIVDLGDRMDGLNGQTTRGGHKLPQNMSNRQAFETAISVEKEFYDMILQSDMANEYCVIANANSNHGGDFDYMVSRALEMYINLVLICFCHMGTIGNTLNMGVKKHTKRRNILK